MPLLTGISIILMLILVVGCVFVAGMIAADKDIHRRDAFTNCSSGILITTETRYVCLRKDAVLSTFTR